MLVLQMTFCRILSLVSCLAASTVNAGEVFDFSDLDVPDPPAAEKKDAGDKPPAGDQSLKELPESIRTIMGKLDRFSAFKRAALKKQISDGRKIAAEILIRNAATADAAARTALLAEASRVESLPPERALIENAAPAAPPRAGAKTSIAFGSWKMDSERRWTNTLLPDGTFTGIRPNASEKGTWQWLAEKRGALVFHYTGKPITELVQFDLKSKRPRATLLSDAGDVYPLVKTETDTPAPAAEKSALDRNAPGKNAAVPEPVKKLADDEVSTRKETEALIESKNVKVAAWLLLQAKTLPASQAKIAVERAAKLEGKQSAVSNSPASSTSSSGASAEAVAKGFGGVWNLSGKKLEFADNGVVKVNKAPGGKWTIAKARGKNRVAFTLDKGDFSAFATLSGSQPGILHIIPVKEEPSDAKRE